MGQQSDDLWMGTATGPQTAGWANSGNPGVIGQGVGPMGRTAYLDIVPVALSATAICAAQAVAAAGNATINGTVASGGVANLDVARGVSIVTSNAGNTTQTVTVTGIDYYGQAQTETLTCNGTTTVSGKKAFEAISQVKLLRMQRLAMGWLVTHDCFGCEYSIDIASVLINPDGTSSLEFRAGIL